MRIMNIKRPGIFVFVVANAMLLVAVSHGQTQDEDQIRKQIVELFPQADINKDGELSNQEYKLSLIHI